MKHGYDVTAKICRAMKDKAVSAELMHAWMADEIRVIAYADTVSDLEDLKGDTFNPKLHPEISAEQLAKEEREFEERAKRMGVYGIAGEFRDQSGMWTTNDACWGFVGEDFLGSGYDEDIARAALVASPGFKRRYA